ncbi:Sodium Bile acid symporter family protein [Rubripirellula lacrimiformis]|uniref:Sodium Bile acid symporter family protein n=1 Tax=Rubripirellula lacrimiformis TaxID=1930273 RepID=A0A517N5U8_9BACT|nr:bile acid:sodium symporter [Rubripirellula lacrimiformis]QDT02481.1 Sodium Bile acid symporter family protein [Rubripirellula lacrimiformis]
MRKIAKNHWFLLSIAACYTAGYLGADVLKPVTDLSWLRDSIVFIVMWAMGVTLRAETVRASISKPAPGLLAIMINLLLIPLLTLPTMWFLPEHLFGGLFVGALVPCTLASASVWTRRAGGDDSIAMLTTVATNLSCVAVVPVGVMLVLSRQADVSAVDQIAKLSLLVVAPLIVGQAMRWYGWGGWADRRKPRLSLVGQFGILAMVVFGAVASRQSLGDGSTTGWPAMMILLVAASAIHSAALAIGVASSRWLGMQPETQIAVGISGSQKTLMVGLQIAIDCGVSVIPMLVYHLSQLVIDTVIADRWKASHSPSPPSDSSTAARS